MITIIPNVYTKKECTDIIDYSKKLGYSDVLTNKFGEEFQDKLFRDDQGVAIENKEFSKELLSRIKDQICEKDIRINPLIRFSKYNPKSNGTKTHVDSVFKQDGYNSKYTVILYLNTISGGETEFENSIVKCIQGQIVIFDQSLPHCGLPTNTNEKYTVRTDILIHSRGKWLSGDLQHSLDKESSSYSSYNRPVRGPEVKGYGSPKGGGARD
jgi:hypothetical protein